MDGEEPMGLLGEVQELVAGSAVSRSLNRRRIGREVWTPGLKAAVSAAQGNLCPICGGEAPTRADALHDMTPEGEPRIALLGVLCPQCKGGLDLLRHDPQRLRSALDYLERPPAAEIWEAVMAGELSLSPSTSRPAE